jgi:hypothetical protein
VRWAERFPGADTVRADELVPGVEHVYLWIGDGPWAVHILEVDEGTCRPVLAAIKAGPPLESRARTSELGDDALAAINADFFMIPGGTPVGPHVHRGGVLVGPGTRPVYALDGAGGHAAGAGRLMGWIASGADTIAVSRVNRSVSDAHHPLRPGVTYLDEWHGPVAPDTGMAVRVRRVIEGVQGGDPGDGGDGTGRGVVARAARADGTARSDGAAAGAGTVSASPSGTGRSSADVELRAIGASARGWLARRAPGDTVVWHTGVEVGGAGGVQAVEAVGGFPLLRAGGENVYPEQEGVRESFGEARHPRTAVGWDEAGRRFFWVVVDGRQTPHSDGMTLPELERLFARLGATDAINLDGGGSSALAIRGRVANRPSDEAGERPVGNALVLERCRTGSGTGGQ